MMEKMWRMFGVGVVVLSLLISSGVVFGFRNEIDEESEFEEDKENEGLDREAFGSPELPGIGISLSSNDLTEGGSVEDIGNREIKDAIEMREGRESILKTNGFNSFNHEDRSIDCKSPRSEGSISEIKRNVYSGSGDGAGGNEVHKIDFDGNQVWDYTDHTDGVYSVAVDDEGNVYSGCNDYEVHKINPEGYKIWTYTEHSSHLRGVAVDQNGNVYSGSRDEEVHKINPEGNKIWAYTEHSNTVNDVAVDQEGYVYSGSSNNELHKIDPNGNKIWSYTEHTELIWGVAVDTEGNVYTASYDEEIHKIDSEGNQLWTYTEHSDNIKDVAVDREGYVYSGSSDNEVHKIDSDGNQVWWYWHHSLNVNDVAVDPDGNVYSGSLGNEVHKIDPNGNQIWEYTRHSHSVNGVAVDPGTVGAGFWERFEIDWVSAGDIVEGETLEVEASITNTGVESDTQTVEMTTHPNIGSDSIYVSLDGGESTTKTFTTGTSLGDDGDYTAYVASEDMNNEDSFTIEEIPEYGVRVHPPTDQSEDSDGTYTYLFVVENTGNVEDIYDLDATADTAGWSADAPDTVTIPAETTESVDVEVTIPSDAEGGEGSEITLESTSQGDSDVSESDSMTVTLEEDHGVSVSAPSDQTETESGTHTYSFDVENTGNIDDTYDLMLTDTEGWTVDISPDPISVDVGETETATAEINIPSDAGGVTSTVTLEGTSQADTTVSDSDSISVTLEEDIDVEVTAPPDATESELGTYTYGFDVENRGNTEETFNLETTADAADWTADAPSTETVQTGSTETVDVDVTISDGAEGGESSQITLMATSQSDGAVSNSDSMTVTYDPDEVREVEVDAPSDATVRETGDHTFEFQVHNTGNVEDTYDLTAEADQTDWSVSAPSEVTVPAGETEEVNIELDIPDGVDDGETSEITLTAESQEEAGVSDSDSMTVTYDPDEERGVAVSAPSDTTVGKTGTHTFEFDVENTGNVDDTYSLTADIDQTGWSVSAPSDVFVSAGETEGVNVEVEIPGDADDGESCEVTLTAESQEDPAVSDSDGMSVNYTTQEVREVDVKAPSDAVEDDPGSYTYYFEVHNTGNVDDTYDLTVDTTNWDADALDSISVGEGDVEEVDVEVTIPEGAEDGESTEVTLIAESQEEPDVSDSDSMTVTYTEDIIEHDLTIDAEEGGTTDPDPGTHTYDEGEEVTVEAIPDTGWKFTHWDGDYPIGEQEEETITVTMDEDKELTAHFEEEEMEEAHFEVEIINYDEEVEEGDEVVVEYSVENVGGIEGEQSVTFYVNGEIGGMEEITLGPGETESGQFVWDTSEGDAGNYDLSIESADADWSGTVMVEEAEEEEDDERIFESWWFILLVLVIIIVVIAVALAMHGSKDEEAEEYPRYPNEPGAGAGTGGTGADEDFGTDMGSSKEEIHCINCGTANDPDKEFCQGCGERMDDTRIYADEGTNEY